MLVAVHKEGATITSTDQEGTAMLSISTTLLALRINQLPSDSREQDEEGTQQNEEYDETDRKQWKKGIADSIRKNTAEHHSEKDFHEIRNLAITTNTSI